jgi:hypothetical protein
VAGQWFSPGIHISSTNKSDHQTGFELTTLVVICTDSEIPKHAGPTDKSGKTQFGLEKHWFPPDRLSGIKYWVCSSDSDSSRYNKIWFLLLVNE